MRGYTVKKIYVVICDRCNEDITRPLSGDDVETRAEAEQLARDHQRAWHSATVEPDSAADTAVRAWADW